MPTIAELDGIRIMIFPFDHDPPHVHAFAPDFRLKLAISDGRTLESRGTVGPTAMRRLRSWTLAYRDRLGELWAAAARGEPIRKIEE
jgi:uncharacterized protein DUF4160